jgi:hypothetical protein
LCQACGHKFTTRRHTVLYRLKTHSARVAEALTFLAEGVDVAVLERVWGTREGTLRTWLTRAGLHARKLHARFFQDLRCAHIQLDELWANVRQASQDVWVWTAVEATTKIIPVIRLGPRTLQMAYAVVHELHHRLQSGFPSPSSPPMASASTSTPWLPISASGFSQNTHASQSGRSPLTSSMARSRSSSVVAA